MEEKWLAWAKKLHAVASTGLFFGADEFDRERYAEVAEIAEAMLTELAGTSVANLRNLFPDFGDGYATPKIDVRAAVFRDDHVLLVQEKTDELWTMPGGYADVGLSAAENAIKETQEEASLTVAAEKLYCVRHKAKHDYRADVRDFYKFFFLCSEEKALEPADPIAGYEVMGAAFWPIAELPPLSTARVIEADIKLAHQHYLQPQLPAVFD